MRSGWKAGNLKVALGLGSRADGGDMATVEQSVVEGSEGGFIVKEFVTPWVVRENQASGYSLQGVQCRLHVQDAESRRA